jgi:hypothetical protein
MRSLAESKSPAKQHGLAVYALAIFVSAFLLFQIEPLLAKTILPWFGGAASVWTTCLLFFQVVLLLGYLYAHLSVRYLSGERQAALHVGLLLASLLLLPVIPHAYWKPSGTEDPGLRILGLLAATVGLPYFLLSSTSPMLQSWYARTRKQALPYRLFALSNAGSMLALLSYPTLVEPWLRTRHQALGWSAGYVVFVGLCVLLALGARGRGSRVEERPTAEFQPPSIALHWLWLALAACPSVLLLAVTNELTQNIAAIPFLWILPLSLYLLSFIFCFEGRAWYNRWVFLPLLAVSLGAMAYGLNGDHDHPDLHILIPFYAGGFFICCMACHGELARLKPHFRHLTSFYLMVALGGAVGGIFVGLVAPRLLNGFYELQAGLAGCAFLILLVLRRDPATIFHKSRWAAAAVFVPALALTGYLSYSIRKSTRDLRLLTRDFYGVLQVKDENQDLEESAVRELTHGTIDHGEQFLDPERRSEPITYYGPSSGIALALRERRQHSSLRVGIIGLGAGTIAAYGRPGDTFRFYDINPQVVRIARSQFTYLSDSQAKIEIALGDARLSLEREAKQNFDVLALDAFSSDSIPVHLLTREAFALYFHHLKDDGVLAVHISNRYLELAPVVQLAADSLGKKAWEIESDDEDESHIYLARWVLVSGRAEIATDPPTGPAGAAIARRPGLRMWTDDYSNLLRVLRRPGE